MILIDVLCCSVDKWQTAEAESGASAQKRVLSGELKAQARVRSESDMELDKGRTKKVFLLHRLVRC